MDGMAWYFKYHMLLYRYSVGGEKPIQTNPGIERICFVLLKTSAIVTSLMWYSTRAQEGHKCQLGISTKNVIHENNDKLFEPRRRKLQLASKKTLGSWQFEVL